MGTRTTPSLAASLALLLAVAALSPAPAEARRKGAGGAPGTVALDGVPTRVRWNDGDGFRIEDGPRRGRRARLAGVNALETYGPVHRWGAWSPVELLAIARASAALAAAEPSTCTTAGETDRYGRLLVACPGAARRLLEAGHAMVFALDGEADPGLLAAQRAAQARGAGMWAKGVPPEIPTSAHAVGERGLGRRGAYDRVVDTRTGAARVLPHARAYAPCEEICAGPDSARACLVHVPFERRYRGRPACIRVP